MKKKLMGLSVLVLILFFTSITAQANAVNNYIISKGFTPATETFQLGKIWAQTATPTGNGRINNGVPINMSYVGGKPSMVIIHEVGVEGGNIQGSIDYMIRTQENAFVHSFTDANSLITIADTSLKSWGSGPFGNRYGIQIELMRVNSKDDFAKEINNAAYYTAAQLVKYDMGPPKLVSTTSPAVDGNLASHNNITYKWGGTNHVDPDGYWNDRASRYFGTTYTMSDFRNLVQRYYDTIAKLPTITSTSIDGDPSTGKFQVTVNTTGGYGYTIKVPIWSNANGQDDIVWYTATKVAEGQYVATFDISQHGFQSGTYTVHAYAFAGSKTSGVSVSSSVNVGIGSVVPANTNPVYRMYDPNSGEHLYTLNFGEVSHLRSVGWNYEGLGWFAPKAGSPVYRLYNRKTSEHLYTTSLHEKNVLSAGDWNYEGVGWYSGGTAPVYRAYNRSLPPRASHHFTADANEQKVNVTYNGWNDEGIAWYGYK